MMGGWMGGWVHGWMDGWVHGWMDAWVVAWADRWMIDRASIHVPASVRVSDELGMCLAL